MGRLDYLHAKIALDRLVDPGINARTVRTEIERMATAARDLAGHGASDIYRLAAVRNVIYEAGPWNDHRPFGYDHDDPYGQNVNNKLLSSYLETRRGNCVSMPTLFLILADRLELDVALSVAPLHVFVRYRPTEGLPVNLETTSGALPAREAWYREKLPMTDLAVATGAYLRSLPRKEGVALMATTVMESLTDQARYQDAINVAEVILEAHPLDVQTMVHQGSVYGELLRTEFYTPYPTPDLIPPNLRARYRALDHMNQTLFARAEALGWTPTEVAP
ncbi:transglutaminase family protein [Brevundimonas sp.]|uniref:transglutaminase family protein n=1 Tax=Brevundimonas sp. TaxID=1871086 RepID=UPI002D2BD1F4|nr:transglutaminase family protein [Brevundimonas sp.]HYC74668.1 transglutaminase family protein [Brevundimonas sp.]